MPFKSKAQRRKFYDKFQRGEITLAEFMEWENGTPPDIPERVSQRKAAEIKPIRDIKPMGEK